MHLTDILVSIFHADMVNFSNRLFGKCKSLFEVQSLFSHQEVIIKVDSSFNRNTWEEISNEDVFLFDGYWRGRKMGCNCFPGAAFRFEQLLNKRKKQVLESWQEVSLLYILLAYNVCHRHPNHLFHFNGYKFGCQERVNETVFMIPHHQIDQILTYFMIL